MANYVLEILDGDRAGEVVPVAGSALRIGRKPGNDLVLADEKTSGVHAEVVLEGDRHVLRDLGSTNGTFLDGKRVTELVLTPGDVVTIGRLRVRFRAEGDAAPADAGELAVHRLDAARAGRRSSSVGLLAGVLVVALGAGGWFWWQNRAAGGGDGPVAQKRPVVEVPGNKLAALAGCEADEGWQRGGGIAFAVGAESHSGSGALQARRGDGEALGFAVVRNQEAVPVLGGRSFTLAAHVRTRGGAQVALRALLGAANEQVPFAFRTGTAFAAADEWTRVTCTVAVPAGCDRLQLEVVALLPAVDAVALVDDVALTEAGDAVALDGKIGEGQTVLGTVIGTGSALAIRSVDPDNPATLLQVLPATVPAALQELQRADLCVLSDFGATIAATPGEGKVALAAQGVDALQLVFPAEAAGGLLVAGDSGSFESTSATGEFSAGSLLVGERLTRAWLKLPGALRCQGRVGGGRFRLQVPTAALELVLSFRAERTQAMEAVRTARTARDEGRPGDALTQLREVLARLPMDSEAYGQAVALRGEILAGQAAWLGRLQQDLDQASFFDTRGGFERVVFGVDELVRSYGEANLQDAAAVAALRTAARDKLAAIDAASHGPQRTRLQLLAKVFGEAQQPGLAQLVQRYIDTHLGKGN